jgi:hypothetical protein
MPVMSRVFIIVFYITYLMLPAAYASQDTPVNLTVPGILGNESGIRVVIDQVYISKKDDHLEVSEVAVFRNDGPGIFYEPGNHTYFAISIPSGAEKLNASAMECCLVQYEDTVFMDPMNPVYPGDNFEMKITYSLFPGTGEYIFGKVAMYNTTSLSVFVDKNMGIGTGEGFSTITIHGDEFKVISFENLSKDEAVKIPLQVSGNTDTYRNAGMFLAVLLAVLAVLSGFKYMKYRAGTKESLEKLEHEKNRIFRTIHGFEKHAGSEESGEYRKLMDEYRQKAINILIKMDKIKNKEPDNNRDNGERRRMFYDIFDVVRRQK